MEDEEKEFEIATQYINRLRQSAKDNAIEWVRIEGRNTTGKAHLAEQLEKLMCMNKKLKTVVILETPQDKRKICTCCNKQLTFSPDALCFNCKYGEELKREQEVDTFRRGFHQGVGEERTRLFGRVCAARQEVYRLEELRKRKTKTPVTARTFEAGFREGWRAAWYFIRCELRT